MRDKTMRNRNGRRTPSLRRLPLAVAVCFACSTAAFAQADTAADAAAPAGGAPATGKDKAKTLDTITVTAQKRAENPQKVPLSLDVLSTQKLEQLEVKDFNDFTKFLPAVTFNPTSGGGQRGAQVYMRGVADGGDNNHSGPLPSVGVYLDEEPITTIDGPLNLHIYDIARVESLAGPQGTLYGASSQSGTLRIITNKPDPKHFEAQYSLEANTVDNGGGSGYVAEGFVNQPFNDHIALRVVAWDKHDAAFIDNAFGVRQFPIRNPLLGEPPSWGGVLNNGHCTSSEFHVCTGTAKNDYNDGDTRGLRAALRINLDDGWTIDPSIVTQHSHTNGLFAYDPQVGFRKVTHFYPENATDNWTQAALTVQGKIGDFDLTYAFAHLNRHEHSDLDYNDYSFWYDALSAYGQYICDHFDTESFSCAPNGHVINPSQRIHNVDGFRKTSHELRLASPQDWRLSFVGGYYWQRQSHDILQDYLIDGLSPEQSVPGWPNTIWLTDQKRVDKDEALFGEATFKITDDLKATAGIRAFRVNNSLEGFFGFADWGWSSSGVASCQTPFVPFNGAPCTEFSKRVKETDHVGKFNLSWQIDPSKMVYATWSEGFRPGGINRKGTLPPYLSDFLTNYEAGWKTGWMDGRLRWNGAVFQENWKDFQYTILGPNSLPEIHNANQARIRGLETNVNWKATDDLLLTGSAAWYDAKLTANYCGKAFQATGEPITNCPVGSTVDGFFFPDGPQAPKGTRLPITPKFKANLVARYGFDFQGMDAYVQGALVHVGERTSDLRLTERTLLGNLPAYTTFDLSFGIKRSNWALDAFIENAFDTKGELGRFSECTPTVCAAQGQVAAYPNGQHYVIPVQPRTYGLRFTQDFY